MHSGILRRRGLLATNFILQELHKELQQEQNFLFYCDKQKSFVTKKVTRIAQFCDVSQNPKS